MIGRLRGLLAEVEADHCLVECGGVGYVVACGARTLGRLPAPGDEVTLFVERPQGTFELRRGFALKPGQRVLMMEDVVITGLSSREAIVAIEAVGGRVVAAASLDDRSNGSADVGVPLHALIRLAVPTYQPDALPPELAAIPAIKPGSRAA